MTIEKATLRFVWDKRLCNLVNKFEDITLPTDRNLADFNAR